MKSFVKLSSVLFLLTSLWSCKKYLTIEEVEGRFLIDQVFSSDSAANSAVAGIYRKWRELHSGTFSPSILCGLSSDELKNYFPQQQYYQDYYSNQISSQNVALPWSDLYNIIYQSNACIEALQKSVKISEKASKYMQGEAKFIRAHCYFYLVNLFGDVPLLLTTNIQKNSLEKRRSMDAVYEQIIEDLKASDLLMSEDGSSQVSRQKINQFTVKAFLARVYLFRGAWSDAYELSNQVILSQQYRLPKSLDSVFLADSPEAIFQFSNNNLDAIGVTWVFIPGSTPNIVCSNSLFNSFENNDLRKEKWVEAGDYLGAQYFYPHKYKIKGNSQSELYTIFRLAEQYLIRSECNIHLLNIPDATNDLNIIRTRAGLASLPASLTPEYYLNALMSERRVELFAEIGYRWFDLKRTGKVNEVMINEKGNLWTSADSLYPIPAADIQRNPNLVQNLNY